MSSTVQTITNLALEKLGIIEVGGTPETAHSNRGLSTVKGYLQHLINSGAFGRQTERIVTDSLYEAREDERIVHDGSVTVLLPTEVPFSGWTDDYGWDRYGDDWSMTRRPHDLAIVSEVRTDTGVVKDSIYDSRTHTWTDINALTLASIAPLSHRDEDGLASAIALRLADAFGQPVPQAVALQAVRFEEALTHNWSQAGEFVEPRDYF